MCQRIDTVHVVGTMRTQMYILLFIPTTIYRKEEQSGDSSFFFFLPFSLNNSAQGKRAFFHLAFLYCVSIYWHIGKTATRGVHVRSVHWPCSRSWRSETKAESASFRAANWTSPRCSIAAKITNRFSTSYTFHKQGKWTGLLRRWKDTSFKNLKVG